MKTIQQIKEQLASTFESSEWIETLRKDERKSVQKLVNSWEKQLEKRQKVQNAFQQKVAFDCSFKQNDEQIVCGIDEAGRGPLAGPVVTAAVSFIHYPEQLLEVNDSKQLSADKRKQLVEIIQTYAESFSIHIQSSDEIDRLNIYEATKQSMTKAVEQLQRKPDVLLVDAMTLPIDIPQHSIIKGDAKSLAIAAASILAKTTRDYLMAQYDEQYPGYDFKRHAGYGTKLHVEAIHTLGPCPIHRKTFEPIKSILK